jgi:hypothetical protein
MGNASAGQPGENPVSLALAHTRVAQMLEDLAGLAERWGDEERALKYRRRARRHLESAEAARISGAQPADRADQALSDLADVHARDER